jgi:hypothetical protein
VAEAVARNGNVDVGVSGDELDEAIEAVDAALQAADEELSAAIVSRSIS